jgi:hypothetical protein
LAKSANWRNLQQEICTMKSANWRNLQIMKSANLQLAKSAPRKS